MAHNVYGSIFKYVDFRLNPDSIPMCSIVVTDVTDQILGQVWLQNPRFEEADIQDGIATLASLVIEWYLENAKSEKKESASDAITRIGAEVAHYLAYIFRTAEEDSPYHSLIPAPSWAPMDVYVASE